ncbi:MAG: hypothetical protein DRO90_00340 [Candidatus Altiarchaeales archaeon]|nr:MAG: hypothetical protein DRO95_03535 [Candidatus Altiarchaeales archaeon]RLI95170.1 MAG: hypothetical protein DRO94_01120 [Candidatus Altiarchaeales archaeon]RLI95440.1 MAG: hypothetical protein DRO90_00340 [Candidatus Altiarchaeales archaeon]HDO82117.1 hypothetical protein [Candidatus Altiarchaeales archaeon]HEX54766.1 hypothetical protein [Candidatus Altiarchaeales archaeon]
MKILEEIKLLHKEEIARRYFIINSFDGALTVLGIITAIFVAGIHEAKVVIVSCLGASVAIAISGVWSAYFAERAERIKAMKELERQMLIDLRNSIVGKSIFRKSLMIAIVNGFSPFIVSMILLIPFILVEINFIMIGDAFYLFFLMVGMILLALGIFTGEIAGENKLLNGVRMLIAGIIVGIIITFIEILKSKL